MLIRVKSWLRSVFLRGRLEREMQEEMRRHLERSGERLQGRGLDAAEAAQAARREFGNVAYIQEQGRDARGGRWLESLIADVRFGLRHFARIPLTTVTMVLVLALGMAINTALFAVLHSVTTQPPRGVARDEALVRIRGLEQMPERRRTFGRAFSYPEVLDLAAQRSLFSDVAAWSAAEVVLDQGDLEQGVSSGSAQFVADNYFRLLGVRPILGAGLPPASPQDFAAPTLVAVISHALWDQHFGRARDVLGKTLKVNDVRVTIVGVAPAVFGGASSSGGRLRLWLPLAARSPVEKSGPAAFGSRDSTFLSIIARLQPDRSIEQAGPVVRGLAARTPLPAGWRQGASFSADVVPLLSSNEGPQGDGGHVRAAISTGGICLLILLVTCTNVSALLVGAGVARRREIAVRLSLGAARARIIRQMVTESVMLALSAAALAFLVIWLLLLQFSARIPDVQIALSWPALAFTFGSAIGAGLLFGLSPAFHATRLAVADVLKESASAVAAGRSWLQRALVVAQIAFTQPLLVGLGALILPVLSELRSRPDVTVADQIALFDFARWAGTATREQRTQDLQQLQERFQAVPGVRAVIAHFEGRSTFDVVIHPDDRVVGAAGAQNIRLYSESVLPGYFALMDIPVVRGRDFSPVLDSTEFSTIVIGRDAARELFGSADPIGRRFIGSRSDGEMVVVGVVDEHRAGASTSGGRLRVFTPARLDWSRSLMVRTRGPAEPMIPLLRSVARAQAPHLPIFRATTLAAREAAHQAGIYRVTAAVAAAGLLALFISAIGLYAVVAFAVAQRTREIGIRTALGAQRQQVVGLFFLRGLRLSVLGLILGLPLSLVGVRVLAAAVDAFSANTSLLTVLIVSLVLAIASLATWLPARKAAGIDPLVALRTD